MSSDNQSIMKFFPREFREFSILALLFNLQSFTEFTFTMNLHLIEELNLDSIYQDGAVRDKYTDKLYSICIVLPLAFMYKNDRAKRYIYDMFEKAGYLEDFQNFSQQIDFVNTMFTKKRSIQFGGGFGTILLFLWAIGAIMIAIIYNYLLYNFGYVPLMETLHKINAAQHLFSNDCKKVTKHSSITNILARGTQNPEPLYMLEQLQDCLKDKLGTFKERVTKREQKKETNKQVEDFRNELPLLIKGSAEVLKLPPVAEDMDNRVALVLHGVNLDELDAKLNAKFRDKEGNVLPAEDIIKVLEQLIQLPEKEFKEIWGVEVPAPAPAPAYTKVPAPKPTWENAQDLVIDIAGVVKIFTENTHIAGGLNPSRVFFRALKDSLKNFQRTLQAGQIKAGWAAADTLEYLQRLVEEVIDLPSSCMWFCVINGYALTGFSILIGLFFSSEEEKAPSPEIEELKELKDPVEELTKQFENIGPLSDEEDRKVAEDNKGGRRKRKTIRKQKKKTHKNKRSKKRRQTKAGKGRRRITRKY